METLKINDFTQSNISINRNNLTDKIRILREYAIKDYIAGVISDITDSCIEKININKIIADKNKRDIIIDVFNLDVNNNRIGLYMCDLLICGVIRFNCFFNKDNNVVYCERLAIGDENIIRNHSTNREYQLNFILPNSCTYVENLIKPYNMLKLAEQSLRCMNSDTITYKTMSNSVKELSTQQANDCMSAIINSTSSCLTVDDFDGMINRFTYNFNEQVKQVNLETDLINVFIEFFKKF